MEIEFRRPKGRKNAISALKKSIEALSLAWEIWNMAAMVTPARAVFDSARDILSMIRVSFLLVLCRPTAD